MPGIPGQGAGGAGLDRVNWSQGDKIQQNNETLKIIKEGKLLYSGRKERKRGKPFVKLKEKHNF